MERRGGRERYIKIRREVNSEMDIYREGGRMRKREREREGGGGYMGRNRPRGIGRRGGGRERERERERERGRGRGRGVGEILRESRDSKMAEIKRKWV
jgi:hypothetical protein